MFHVTIIVWYFGLEKEDLVLVTLRHKQFFFVSIFVDNQICVVDKVSKPDQIKGETLLAVALNDGMHCDMTWT